MIITICGSTRFKDEIREAARNLTLAGHIVMSPEVYHHSEDEEIPAEAKIQLDNLHREKINMSDAIYVVNPERYIGESTFGEIDWAQRMKKAVYFMVPMEDEASAEEGKTAEAPVEEIEEVQE